jgi:iron complex outermembrane receptor protein
MCKRWIQQIVVVMVSCVANVAAWGGAATMPSKSPATLPAAGLASPADTDFAEPESQALPSTAQPSKETPELEFYTDLPVVVVAAAKHEQAIEQAPASVTVVSAGDIDLFGYENLADVLRDQRSFYLQTDGLNWFVGVRGFSRAGEWNSRISVLVDDRPTNELIYGQSHLDTDFVVPMEAIKQVEIVRGPGSAIYGTNAVFGVINVVTKNGSDVNGVQTTLTGGTQQTGQANVLFGKDIDGWDVLADFNVYNTAGDKHQNFTGVDTATDNFGNIDDSAHEAAYEGFVKIKKGEFTAEIDSENRHKDDEFATYDTSFFDPGSMEEQRQNVMLRIDHEIDADKSLHAMAYFGRYSFFQTLPYATDDTGFPTYTYTQTANDDWLGQTIYYDDQITKKLRVLAGAQGTEAIYIRQQDFESIPGAVPNIPSSYSEVALFAEAEYQLNEQLNLTAGVRGDDVQRLPTSVSPRLAAIYTPDKPDAFKALYGRAFRDPNLNELEYFSPGSNTPNPELKPEIVDTCELVWERQYVDGWSSSLDGYYWVLHNAMDSVTLPDGSSQTQNVGSTTADGIEAEIDRRWDKRATFRLFGTYTWADSYEGLPPQSPKWILGTALAMPIWKQGTFLSLEPQIVGPMKNANGQFTHTSYVTNLVLTSDDLIKGWTFQAGVYNLFSNASLLPGGAEQVQPYLDYPGTQFRVSLTCRF